MLNVILMENKFRANCEHTKYIRNVKKRKMSEHMAGQCKMGMFTIHICTKFVSHKITLWEKFAQ